MLKVIDNAERKAFEDTAYGVIEAVKLAYTEDVANEVKTLEKTYQFPNGDLKLSGEKPKGGNASINENGKISIAIYDKKQKYCAIKNTNEEKVTVKDFKGSICDNGKGPDPTPDVKDEAYQNGTAIYYNPETNTKCTESGAVSTTGTKTGCMKWYAFNDKVDATTVNMILDHNTTATIAWNESGNLSDEPVAINNQLKSDVTKWNSNLNARLITAMELYKFTYPNSSISLTDLPVIFELRDHTSHSSQDLSWLSDNIESGSTKGYWTSTVDVGRSLGPWFVEQNTVNNAYGEHILPSTNDSYGIRPVITVSKTVIK